LGYSGEAAILIVISTTTSAVATPTVNRAARLSGPQPSVTGPLLSPAPQHIRIAIRCLDRTGQIVEFLRAGQIAMPQNRRGDTHCCWVLYGNCCRSAVPEQVRIDWDAEELSRLSGD
jgi:hypothetical protein